MSADPLARCARASPEALAVEWEGGRCTYAELDAAATRVAGRVATRLEGDSIDGSRPPVVAAFLPPTVEAIAAIHGVSRAGAALAPLHTSWTATELSGVLERLRPAVVLRPRGHGPDTEPATGHAAERLDLDWCASSTLREAAVPGPPRPTADGVHTILSTSGSTGRPRLVALRLANHVASAEGAIERLGLGPGDRWLASLSLAHVGGLALILRAAVAGSTVVLGGRFDAEAWTDLLDSRQITHLSLVPTMLRRLLDRRGERPAPPTLAAVLLGGAPAEPDLLERALAGGWPVALTYGLTEAASQVATAEPDRVRRKPGTVGPPLTGTEIELEEDEILVRGHTVGPGYWDEPADRHRDGWLRTGDLGRLDDDGDLWIVGRRSSRIVSGGVTVDPDEVEAVVRSHPGVRDAAVVGLPDSEWGERVVAGVVPADPGTSTRGLFAELSELCRARLAAPKRPKAFTRLDRLPRTPTGKTDRAAVRRRLEGGE